MKNPLPKLAGLVAGVIFWSTFSLLAQEPPVIITQPAGEATLAGASATFSVAVSGPGPFVYHWQFNGTNFPNNLITTAAGNGTATYAGDGLAALSASLNGPTDVAFDTAGNLYIADTSNNRIRKVNTNHVITSVAGTGSAAFSGDGGPAAAAALNAPSGVLIDVRGNLYIGDTGNHRIRQVATNGVITTWAGNGLGGYTGDGGPATNASLDAPGRLAFDSAGVLYVADSSQNCVRQVRTNGVITTVAGGNYASGPYASNNAALYGPDGIALDARGNLFIADTANNRVCMVAPNNVITTVAGIGGYSYATGDGGAATNASINYPAAVAFDATGNYFITAGYDNNDVRMVNAAGIITTVAGAPNHTYGGGGYSGDGAAATNATLQSPGGEAFDGAGNLYVADAGNNRIREVLFGGSPTLVLSNLGPQNTGNYTVVVSNSQGSVTSVVASLTVELPPAMVLQPASQAISPGSNATLNVLATGTQPLDFFWYFNGTNLVQSGTQSALGVTNFSAANEGLYQVVVTNTFGSVTSSAAILELVPAITVLASPLSQTILAGSNVSFAVSATGIGPFTYQWQLNGTNLPNNLITTVAGNGTLPFSGDGAAATNTSFWGPCAMTVGVNGNLYISDSGHNLIRMVDGNGIVSTVGGDGNEDYTGDGVAATNTSLFSPRAITFDPAGNLYFADAYNQCIRKIDLTDLITTVAGDPATNHGGAYGGDGGPSTNAFLSYPSGAVLDPAGNLYLTDSGNHRIRKVDAGGTITTIAGNGTATFAGDGGPATNASLNNPVGLVRDDAGILYFTDSGNNRLRKVDAQGIITTIAGNGAATYAGDGGVATNASLNNPLGLARDATGNWYISDNNNSRIRRVDTNGIITTVAGNGQAAFGGDAGPATNASLDTPFGVSLDPLGNLYIADTGNNRIREVHFAGYPNWNLVAAGTNQAGNYQVVISGPYGSVTSAVAVLTVVLPPSILVPPASQGVVAGGMATLSVTAGGTPPLNYLWYFNATNLVQSGTNSSLIVSNLSAANTGGYQVVITNNYASTTSAVATLAFAPTATIPPGSQTIVPGANASFGLVVGGVGPFTYQWRFNGTNLPANLLSTVAGNGSTTYSGDGGQAVYAGLNGPPGVALDAQGNLYIADTGHVRIRRVGLNGIITTVAGTASYGYSGDGGPATNATLYLPDGVAVDTVGNLYVADANNNRIRKVDTNGIISTFAGNGTSGYAGDGLAATNASLNSPQGVALDGLGNLYIADFNNNCIRRVSPAGIITTVAGTTGYAPWAVAADALGDVYMADRNNNRVREVTAGGSVAVVAGIGPNYPVNGTYSGDGGAATNAGLKNPFGLAVDAAGELYISDAGDNRIRKVDPTGIITTVAGKGTATFAGDGGAPTNGSLNNPTGVAVDAAGNLYVADTGNQRIREVLLAAAQPTLTLLNANQANAGQYDVVVTSPYGQVTAQPAGLIVAAPALIIAQPASQTVVAGRNATFAVTVAGTGPFGYVWFLGGTNVVLSSTNAELLLTNVSPALAGNYTVVITNAFGSATSKVATLGVALPPGVAVPPLGQAVPAGSNVSFTVTASGTGPFSYQWQWNGTNLPRSITTVAGGKYGFSGDGGPATNAGLSGPNAVTVDSAGNTYIADWGNGRVRKVLTNGLIMTVAGGGSASGTAGGKAATNCVLSAPAGVAVDAAGNFFVSENGSSYVAKIGTNGLLTMLAGKGVGRFAGDNALATNAYLNGPFGLALDSAGDLFIADTADNRIREIITNGTITTVAGNGLASFGGDGGLATNAALNGPWGVFPDGQGNLFIADSGNNRIRKVGPGGVISTIAGNGANSYSGDGGPATNAGLAHPDAIVLDPVGDLVIADANNARVRQVDRNGIITTIAGGGGDNSGGDGPATSAALSVVTSVAADILGNVIVDDNYNNRIRSVLASTPLLGLTNVTATNVGIYSVVITSPYGSVTSAPAALTILLPRTPPQIGANGGGFGFQTNQFGFTFSGQTGQTLVVDASTNLVDWTPLFTNIMGGSPVFFFDSASTNLPRRFYRVRLP